MKSDWTVQREHASNSNLLILKSVQPDFVYNWYLKQWTARSDSQSLNFKISKVYIIRGLKIEGLQSHFANLKNNMARAENFRMGYP